MRGLGVFIGYPTNQNIPLNYCSLGKTLDSAGLTEQFEVWIEIKTWSIYGLSDWAEIDFFEPFHFIIL